MSERFLKCYFVHNFVFIFSPVLALLSWKKSKLYDFILSDKEQPFNKMFTLKQKRWVFKARYIKKSFIAVEYLFRYLNNFRSSYALLVFSLLVHGICGTSVMLAGIFRLRLLSSNLKIYVLSKSCFYQVVSLMFDEFIFFN